MSNWDKLFGGMDKQTSLLVLNLVILAVVIWLMYTLADSYASVLSLAKAGKDEH